MRKFLSPASLLKHEKLRLVAKIMLAGFLFAVLYHVCLSQFVSEISPWRTFLFDPNDRFNDFYNTIVDYKVHGISISIFPTVNLLYLTFSFFGDQIRFFAFVAIFVVYFLILVGSFTLQKGESWKLNAQIFGGIALCGYPFLFAIDRGNIEMYLFIILSLFVLLFRAQRYFFASLFLALGIGMKLFPAVFVILYLKQKKYRELMYVGGWLAVIAGVLSMFQDWNVIMARTDAFFILYMRDYTIGDAGLGHGNSIYGMLKTLLYAIAPGQAPHQWLRENSAVILRSYTVFTFMIYGCYAAFIYFSKNLTYWKQVALLTALFCLLPNVSGDYKLLHLYIPLLLFFDTPAARYDVAYARIFGLLLIPKAYFYLRSGGGMSTIAEPMLMMCLVGLITYDEWQAKKLAIRT